jgi:hypothetical protein
LSFFSFCFNFLSNAELHNPETGQFTAANSLTVARGQHTATRLSDGLFRLRAAKARAEAWWRLRKFTIRGAYRLPKPAKCGHLALRARDVASQRHRAARRRSG